MSSRACSWAGHDHPRPNSGSCRTSAGARAARPRAHHEIAGGGRWQCRVGQRPERADDGPLREQRAVVDQATGSSAAARYRARPTASRATGSPRHSRQWCRRASPGCASRSSGSCRSRPRARARGSACRRRPGTSRRRRRRAACRWLPARRARPRTESDARAEQRFLAAVVEDERSPHFSRATVLPSRTFSTSR